MSTFFKWMTQLAPPAMVKEYVAKCLKSPEAALRCSQPGGAFFEKILREVMPAVPQVLFDEASKLNKSLSTCCQSGYVGFRCVI
jgi:hypothetical protein